MTEELLASPALPLALSASRRRLFHERAASSPSCRCAVPLAQPSTIPRPAQLVLLSSPSLRLRTTCRNVAGGRSCSCSCSCSCTALAPLCSAPALLCSAPTLLCSAPTLSHVFVCCVPPRSSLPRARSAGSDHPRALAPNGLPGTLPLFAPPTRRPACCPRRRHSALQSSQPLVDVLAALPSPHPIHTLPPPRRR